MSEADSAYAAPEATPPKKGGGRIWLIVLIILLVIGIPVCGGLLCCGGCGAFFGTLAVATEGARSAAVAKVKENPQLRERLGEPIEVNEFNTNTSINGSTADVHLHAEGPNGGAEVDLKLRQAGEDWEVTSMTATYDNGETVELDVN